MKQTISHNGAEIEVGFQPMAANMWVDHNMADRICRGEDPDILRAEIDSQLIQRGITSTQTGFPVREDLEAEVQSLVPIDTPVRDLLPRKMGSGLAHIWKAVSSYGGGYGFQTLATLGGSGSWLQVNSTAGARVGDQIYFASGAVTKTVSTVDSTIQITLTDASGSWSAGDTVYRIITYPDGGAAAQVGFAESSAPATFTPTFVPVSATYKLLGCVGTITGLAIAAGSNFQDTLAYAKMVALKNLLVNEENILINGSTTSVAAPFGDGTTNYCFAGLCNAITAANGTPAVNIQTAVGQLTMTHLNQQLNRLWQRGGKDMYIIMAGQESNSLTKLAQADASSAIFFPQMAEDATFGARIAWLAHPITGQKVPIYNSRHLNPGTIIFGSKYGPEGQPAAEVVVLPAVPVRTNPGELVQGYFAQSLPAVASAPMLYGYLVAVAEVLCFYNYQVFAISTGVTSA